jgi:BON domain
MPTPFEIITKPLQIGAQIAFGVIGNIQKLLGGQQEEAPAPEPQQQQPEETPQRRSSTRPKPLDDVTITRKVESELFRDSRVNKGKVSVNTADGVVSLRGEAKTPELIKELEAKAREIPEVQDVENLLHLPKTPARRSTKAKTAAARKRAPKRTTSERKSAVGEPAPKDLARKHEGRQPAPLGSTNGGSGSDS